ncbi:hypothetical protein, partial [Asanoa sp. NPDC050611]|uniref:hypothetical protein n=1 Tax=Asanoa sp. NPDC050611 TaxID=3157098 RepID=UPI0033E1ACA1
MEFPRALPGPAALAAWCFATVTLPLLFFDWTHRWEEDQPVSTALWWAAGAAPLLAATAAAKWRWHARRGGLLAAGAVATLVAMVFLGGSLAVFRWVIPLTGSADWARVVLSGAVLAGGGGALGYLLGSRRPRRNALAGHRGYAVGALVALLGGLFLHTTVRLGAEGSTAGPDLGATYGGVGPITPDEGVLTLPSAGEYAIYAIGFAPSNPDCRVGNAQAKRLTIPPGDYGGDYASYTWIASFEVDAPGTYPLSCQTPDADASYTVGDLPRVRGLVGAMIHWPLTTIWLLGAIPGLLIIADAVTRRTRTR